MANLSAPSATWENRSPGAAAALGILIIDADGFWAMSDDPAAVADGVFVLDSGELAIDPNPAASGALPAIRYGTDYLVVI